MAQPILDQMLDKLNFLEKQELYQLMHVIQRRIDEPRVAHKGQQWQEVLLTTGFIAELRPPRNQQPRQRSRIEIQGEPLSQTIIRERR